jgi:redox-sensing transcriptional repressor
VARLPVYLRSLAELVDEKTTTVSSERLAEMAGVNAAKVRKDLSYLGSYGTRGVGYDVEYLLFQMSRELGLTHDWPVVIVGAGNLGQALANYGGFTQRGFPVAALIDADASKVGQHIHGVEVHHIDDLPRAGPGAGHRHRHHRHPGGAAQDRGRPAGGGRRPVDPELRAGGDHGAPGASLRKVDLALELQILSFYQEHRDPPTWRRPPGPEPGWSAWTAPPRTRRGATRSPTRSTLGTDHIIGDGGRPKAERRGERSCSTLSHA